MKEAKITSGNIPIGFILGLPLGRFADGGTVTKDS